MVRTAPSVRTLSEPYSSLERQTEFSIHGVLGVTLLNAEACDVATVRRHLGPLEKSLSREPDLVVRFTKRLPIVQTQHQEDSFVVLDKLAAQIAVNFGSQPCEILCQSGLRSIAVLLPILSLVALKKGYVAVHGSALLYDGVGVVLAGHATSGKTTTLLGFGNLGAEFVGDDWLLLRSDGQKMHGLPAAIDISPKHVESSRLVRHILTPWRRRGFDVLGAVAASVEGVVGHGSRGRFVKRAVRRIVTAIQRRIIPRIQPQQLFAKCATSFSAKPQKVFFFLKHDEAVVHVKEIHPKEMAELLSQLAEHEQKDLMELYQTFRFAFPQCNSILFEDLFTRQREILTSAVAPHETYIIRHPYPVCFVDLYKRISPLLASTTKGAEVATSFL